MLGFGISGPEQVRAAAGQGARGVIVGSAIVQRIAEQAPPREIERFVGQLKAATKRA